MAVFTVNDRESTGRKVIRPILYAITTLSYGNFNPKYFGMSVPHFQAEEAQPQTYLVLFLWILLISCSFFRGVLVTPLRIRGLFWPILFLCVVAVSPLWSEDPVVMAPKAIVFLIVSFGIWRIASIFSVAEIITITTRCTGILMIASAIALIVEPSIAVGHEFRREVGGFEDLWQGVYEQKQGLGMVGAVFMFLTLMRTLNRRSFVNFLGFLLGLILVIGSGSRGGAIVAMGTPLAIMAARRYPWIFQLIVGLILIELVAAIAMICYLAYTGNDSFLIWGNEIDISERTFIWQYALHLWMSCPLLGFGLNGFWFDPGILWGFLRIHGWVIGNYHSGYVAILIETGLLGISLFVIVVWGLCTRLNAMVRSGSNEVLEIAIGLFLITFTINLTETTILLSSNYGRVLFTFLLINVYSPLSSRVPAKVGRRVFLRPA